MQNTEAHYGVIARSFHWLTALLIFSAFPLGFIAEEMSESLRSGDTNVNLDTVVTLFSLHKTIGIAIFFTASARVIWALIQPKPKLLNGDHKTEALLAETVHWLLYGSLILVPLSGWIHHAATTGFAPIWWPFGQGLPLVPQSQTLSGLASDLHFLLMLVLATSIALHVAGALKHHVIDKDATLRRMISGHTDISPSKTQPSHILAAASAAVIWVGVLAAGTASGLVALPDPAQNNPAPQQTAGAWQVSTGTLNLSITQMGAQVAGTFTGWSAQIDYDDTAATAQKGQIDVTIPIAGLQLGSVSDQAMGPDYFDADKYPTAQYQAALIEENGTLTAQGQLSIKGNTVDLSFPVTLDLDGNTAHAQGKFRLDRRAFSLGDGIGDASTLGFDVDLSFDLTATR
ncbi:cytochrome b/b6 domain-containing protein [Thalassovita sp.]|uniref:cytochrome b/b6 domain-containing protein n=1 Tax=Thalassovita sp. TaxID=1979401 RepID=UPI002B276720|nr:cytochrome b/b6 domain-containing protein [Thalassovita sp.]